MSIVVPLSNRGLSPPREPMVAPGELLIVLNEGDAAAEYGIIFNRAEGTVCLAIEGFLSGLTARYGADGKLLETLDGTAGYMTGTGVKSVHLSEESPEPEIVLDIPREIFGRRIG